MTSFEGLSKIGQINIPVHNLESSITFYRDSLGMKFLFQVPGMAFFECEGIRILLAVPEDRASDHPSSIVYFRVDDIHSATDALRGRGVEFSGDPALVAEMPDHDLWMSFFKDPDDNTLALMSEVARPIRKENS
jgi:catechol 2,3-dioxygenase-like lactoylglutathione lyase family enzyme